MGSQIAILGDQDDMVELLGVAEKHGARAVTQVIPVDEIVALHEPVSLFRSRPQKILLLLPSAFEAVEVFPVPVDDDSAVSKVNGFTSPVVQVTPARAVEEGLRAGRIYLGLTRSHSLYRPARNLYDALVRSTRGWARTRPDAVRVGPRLAESCRRDGLQLMNMFGFKQRLP